MASLLALSKRKLAIPAFPELLQVWDGFILILSPVPGLSTLEHIGVHFITDKEVCLGEAFQYDVIEAGNIIDRNS
jgi:hypothetical protein